MKTVVSSLACNIALIVLAWYPSTAAAQEKPPTAGDAPGFAYAAPAFIKELDTRYPVQPPVPPSPPRYGGVLHFPATVRAFDPTAGYRPELALVWDTLTEWEATWYFPEVQRTPVIRKTLATSWEMVNPSTWIFKLRQGVKFHNRPPVNGREMTAEDVKYSYELLKDKAQYSTRAALVKAIQVVDKYTVKFELSLPDPKFYLDVLYSLMKTVPDMQLYRVPSFGWGDYGVSMALDKAPYNDARVRQALSMAINRDVVAEVIDRGDAALYGPFPWALAGYTKRTDYTYANLGSNYEHSPKKAKELLAAAGYPNGFDMELEWAEFQGWTFNEFVQLVARFFGDEGVRVKLKQLETSTWIAKAAGVQPFPHTLAAFSPIGAGPSFMDWVYLRYHSSFPRTINREGISDPKLDDLLTTWRLDPGEKRRDIQRAIWDHLRKNVYRITTIVPPHYRVGQAYVHAAGNPYCWFPGYCSYEAKTAWMTEKAPSRKFEKFAQ